MPDEFSGPEEEHPSYGMIGYSRQSGGSQNLFGSALRHQHCIHIQVRHGRVKRALSHEWYSAGRGIVDINLSHTQFAEFITGCGLGDGVPCTIRYLGGKPVDPCPDNHVEADFQRELQAKTDHIAEDLATLLVEAERLLDEKLSTKHQREELRARIRHAVQELTDRLPFIHASYQEAMVHTTTAARIEVEAYADHVIHALGMEALGQRLVELPGGAPLQLAGEGVDGGARSDPDA